MTDRTETDEILDGYLTADFDPLQAFTFDDDTDADDEAPSVLAEGPFNMPNPEAAPQFQRDLVAFDNGETAEERIDALFAQMPTFHKMLFTIMGTCASPLPTADLEEVIAEMKRHHHSVYEPLTLCNLLERAGAIAQTDENGTPLAEVERPGAGGVLEPDRGRGRQAGQLSPDGDDRRPVRDRAAVRRHLHHLP